MSELTLAAINIQYPISQDILSGKKTIETRTYPIPNKYLNCDVFLMETPGDCKDFKSRIVGIIRFSECIQYKNKNDFYQHTQKHLVTKNSKWAWKDKPKFGWVINKISLINHPIEYNGKKGIKFTKEITVVIEKN